MWPMKRVSVSFTPRSHKRPTSLLKRRPSCLDKTSTNIKVVVRVRPPNERDSGCRQVVQVVGESYLIFDPKEGENDFFVGGHKQLNRDMLRKRNKNMEFHFDQVYDQDSSNQEVFEGTTQGLIFSLLDGFNCSVFVYGATGAGKTYTMLGSKETPGISYLTMVELYKRMDERDDYKFDLKISYLEVYNEMVKDLICPSGPLPVLDDGKNGVIISGIKMHSIDSADELFRMLECGNRNRTQHPTDSNAESSRSHAVFQVHLSITHKLSMETKISKLTMIDLAGSERGAATGGKGARFSEGSNINKSLLALGNCVDALAEGHKHVPYRNSKLTRILKDSLGGNCKTVMIVNVGPSSVTYEETFNTLNYANRAKKISNKVQRNLLSVNATTAQYKKIIEELKDRNFALEREINTLKEGKTADSKIEKCTNTADIEKGRHVLRCLYELEERYSQQLLMYQIKKKTLDWRIYQKQVISARFRIFEYMISDNKNQSRMDEAISNLKMQRKVFRDKVKSIQKLLKEKRTLREIALKEIEAKGLLGELQSDINNYAAKMNEEKFQSQTKYYKNLLLKQQHEMSNSDDLISRLCKTMDYYFRVLDGFGKITEQMKEQHMVLVHQLAGEKGVTWEDESSEYSILHKIMDLSYISEDSKSPQISSLAGYSDVCPGTPKEIQPLIDDIVLLTPLIKNNSPEISFCVPSTPSVALQNIADYCSPEDKESDDESSHTTLVMPPPTPLKAFSKSSSQKFNPEVTFVVEPSVTKETNTGCIESHLTTVFEEIPEQEVKIPNDLNVTFESPRLIQNAISENPEREEMDHFEDSQPLNTTFTRESFSPQEPCEIAKREVHLLNKNENVKDTADFNEKDPSPITKFKSKGFKSNLPVTKNGANNASTGTSEQDSKSMNSIVISSVLQNTSSEDIGVTFGNTTCPSVSRANLINTCTNSRLTLPVSSGTVSKTIHPGNSSSTSKTFISTAGNCSSATSGKTCSSLQNLHTSSEDIGVTFGNTTYPSVSRGNLINTCTNSRLTLPVSSGTVSKTIHSGNSSSTSRTFISTAGNGSSATSGKICSSVRLSRPGSGSSDLPKQFGTTAKYQVRTDEKCKIRPGATIKLQYNVLAEKNKVIGETPRDHGKPHLDTRKIISHQTSSSKKYLKENKIMTSLRVNSPQISPKICDQVIFMKPNGIPGRQDKKIGMRT